jgi:hypothetical protein
VDLTVLATSVYGGKGFEKKLQEGEPDKTVRVPVPRSSLEALARLQSSGVKLGVWDIWDQIGAAILKGDPRLKGIDPALVARNQDQRRLLKSWLEGVQKQLTKPVWGYDPKR